VRDEISLTIPRDPDFFEIAHLVLGGLGARLDLTWDSLEDLQIALAGLLGGDESEGDVTVTMRIDDSQVLTAVGPFDPMTLHARLERKSDEYLTIRRMLEAIMDRVEVGPRPGGDWVELTKRVELAEAEH
jgi:hypothetical protein